MQVDGRGHVSEVGASPVRAGSAPMVQLCPSSCDVARTPFPSARHWSFGSQATTLMGCVEMLAGIAYQALWRTSGVRKTERVPSVARHGDPALPHHSDGTARGKPMVPIAVAAVQLTPPSTVESESTFDRATRSEARIVQVAAAVHVKASIRWVENTGRKRSLHVRPPSAVHHVAPLGPDVTTAQASAVAQEIAGGDGPPTPGARSSGTRCPPRFS